MESPLSPGPPGEQSTLAPRGKRDLHLQVEGASLQVTPGPWQHSRSAAHVNSNPPASTAQAEETLGWLRQVAAAEGSGRGVAQARRKLVAVPAASWCLSHSGLPGARPNACL